jgi:hypothetical protein
MQISQHGPCVFYTLVVYACYYSICKNMFYFNVYSYDIFCLVIKPKFHNFNIIVMLGQLNQNNDESNECIHYLVCATHKLSYNNLVVSHMMGPPCHHDITY